MSAREALYAFGMSGKEHSPDNSNRMSREINAYRAGILAEVAVTVRAAAPKSLDSDVDVHVFQVLNDLAAKIARGDLS